MFSSAAPTASRNVRAPRSVDRAPRVWSARISKPWSTGRTCHGCPLGRRTAAAATRLTTSRSDRVVGWISTSSAVMARVSEVQPRPRQGRRSPPRLGRRGSNGLTMTGRAPLPRSSPNRQRGRRYEEDDMDARRAVVVGVDGSAQALRAVQWAVPEARRRRAVLRLITAVAWTNDQMAGLPGMGAAPYGAYLRRAAENGLAAAAAAAAEVDPDVPVEQDIVIGFPGGVLHEQSQTAELLVVGDSGRGRIASALAGSVAIGVAARSACPVVVVRGGVPAPDAPVVVG